MQLIVQGFAIHHHNGDDTIDAEVAIPVSSKGINSSKQRLTLKGENRGDIHFRESAGGKCVSLVVKGGYEHLKGAHDQAKEYVSANGHTTKEIREVYLKGPKETTNSDEYQTEIQYLI